MLPGYSFEPLSEIHRYAVIDLFNHYIENSFAAYPEQKVTYDFFDKILESTNGYPAFAVLNMSSRRFAGFCFLKQHHPFPVFKEAADITYFIDPLETGKGIGKESLHLLEQKAAVKGIKQILASISSLNKQSHIFHLKNGFRECGRFENIGKKNGKYFDVIWMQKDISGGRQIL